MRTLVERASRWLVNNRRPPLDSAGTVEQFSAPVQRTMAELPDLMSGRELAAYVERKEALEAAGVPEELASRIAVLPPAYMLLGVIEIAEPGGASSRATVARLHFALGERLGLPALVQRILALPRADRWQTMARAALRDDLHAVHAQLTGQVLARTSPDDSRGRPDRRLGGRRGGRRTPRHGHARGDLCRGPGRPGPALGRPAGGPRAARVG